MAYSDENKTPVAIGFLDIDDFRNFNTNYGHQVGDDVICYVAKTLQENISGEVGRIGGDEFVFCYAGAIGDEKMKADAARILKLLQEKLHQPRKQRADSDYRKPWYCNGKRGWYGLYGFSAYCRQSDV